MSFDSVLVANRGEIAIRVFRTLRELSLRSVAIYSDADRDALHVQHADEAWCIGGQLPGESYLDQAKVLEAVRRSGAQAVHPGYGFLAENATFARACASAGVKFIGPHAEAIERMGSKTGSREVMRAAGVPIVPGTTEPLESLDAARAAADEVGYPVAIKARSGGGGKGFRVALDPGELAAAFDGASREGERYFSDAAVYVERYLHDPRHVEVQILGDEHGNVIHLGERDCTVQRRHQKLVEESPCPVADDAIRARLTEIALGAARAVDYTSAGTVECLLDASGQAWFLEMNTRVQVEHTVTELVTGIDIVAEQIRIAQGAPLSLTQDDVRPRGHALEVRINAEDARADFRPSSGPITRWREPGGIGVRVDAGFAAGREVSQFYDTLLAKLIVHAADRDAARARMARALDEFDIAGVETLVEFHRMLVASDEFGRAESCRDMVNNPVDHLPRRAADTGVSSADTVPAPTDIHLVEVDGHRFEVAVHDPAPWALRLPPRIRDRSASGAAATGDVAAPIPGNVLQVLVSAGQQVRAGEVVCILEAMKMENEIAAGVDGSVETVSVVAGDSVSAGQLLLTLTPAG
jgi:acetyl-CoA/propionyl-CoA carboxylase biotin carboxyl carrier protein